MTTNYPNETNPLPSSDYHKVDRSTTVAWDDARLASISRFRLLTDPGFPMWDVSYCHGILKDGRECRVALPFDQLPKRGMNAFLIAELNKAKLNGHKLGIWDALSKLW